MSYYVCIDNEPIFYKDGSSDEADRYLTVGKTYFIRVISDNGKDVFLDESDLGGFPYGHRWMKSFRFISLEEHRLNKLKHILNGE